MSDWQFVKIKTSLGESLVMSASGGFSRKPIAILDENDINHLISVWKEKKTYE